MKKPTQPPVLDDECNESPQGAREEPKVEMVDMSDAAFVVTNVRAKKVMQEVENICTRAQKIITSNSYGAKELLEQTVIRDRLIVVRFEVAGKTVLEDAMFHQACATRDLKY